MGDDDSKNDKNDPNGSRRLRAVPRAPREDSELEMPPDVHETEVLVRRIDKKVDRYKEGDLPWLRRIVGLAIIGATFYYGWTTLDRQSAELMRRKQALTQQPGVSPLGQSGESEGDVAKPSPKRLSLEDAAEKIDSLPAYLDAPTVTMISECTKGANAFRLLNFNPEATTKGEATLESIFKPVVSKESPRIKHTLQLQNVRIRAKNGEEWRLHAAPQGENSLRLEMKLFRVASDGLPEEIAFPPEIKDLAGQPLTDEAVSRFLALADKPGNVLEIEKHEAWSFPDKAGAQLIWSGPMIFDLQVFMREKFLACSRGEKAGVPNVICKCVQR